MNKRRPPYTLIGLGLLCFSVASRTLISSDLGTWLAGFLLGLATWALVLGVRGASRRASLADLELAFMHQEHMDYYSRHDPDRESENP